MSSRLTTKKSTGNNNQLSKKAANKLKPNKPLANKRQTFALSSTAFSVCVALSSYALPSIINPALAAGPKGGVVVSGSGSITKDAAETIIKQNSQHMAINWDSYNVASGERVQYIQPNSQSVSLNNILSSNGSVIAGNIDANGKVILVNPNGIVFTQSSTLNVGSLVASGLSITPDDFINGNFVFDALESGVNGDANGAVINHGIINAATGGSVTLLGKQVENHGYISANLGAVNLAVGKQAVLTFDAGGLLGVRVTDEILQEELGLDPALVNSGEINAKGGRVLLTASTSQDVFSQAVNSGVEQATSVVVHDDGSFTLGGGADVLNTGTIDVSINESVDAFLLDELKQANESFDLSTNTTSSNINSSKIVILGDNITSSGQLLANTSYVNDTSSVSTNALNDKPSGEIELHAQNTTLLTENSQTIATSDNGIGGIVKVLGDNVGLFDNALVDASGGTGGTVLIGGDQQGLNAAIPNAEFVYIAENSVVQANGLSAIGNTQPDFNHNGDGGTVITFASDTTRVYGQLSALGGALGGDGGFIETSGLQGFDIQTVPLIGAEQGQGGEWLIDPNNITISNVTNAAITETGGAFTSNDDGATLNVLDISLALGSGDVTITTTSSGTNLEEGNIYFADNTTLDFHGTSTKSLTLNAVNNITFGTGSKILDSNPSNGDKLTVNLNANYLNTAPTGGGIIELNNAVFTLQRGSFSTGSNTRVFNGANATISTASSSSGSDRDAGTINIQATDSIDVGVLNAQGLGHNSNGGQVWLTAPSITLNKDINATGGSGGAVDAGIAVYATNDGDSVTINHAADFTSPVTIQGGAGTQTITGPDLSGTEIAETKVFWIIDGTNEGSLTTTDDTNFTDELNITFTSIETLQGGSGDDQFRFWSVGTIDDIYGGTGANEIRVSTNGSAGEFNITGKNSGSVTDYVTGFSDIQTLLGNDNGDAFNFYTGSSIEGIDGQTGTDTINLIGNDITLNLTNVAGIETLTNTGNDNILQGADGVSNTFTLNGAGSGEVTFGADTLDFTNFIKLIGGDSANNFILTDGVISAATLDGGTGTSTITGDNNSRTWTVDGAGAGNVSGYSFLNIDNLEGGSAVDTFNVSSTIGDITGNAGNDIITVTNASADSIANIYGNDGDDTISLDNTSVVTGTIDGGLHDTQDEFILTGSGETLSLTSVTAFELLTNSGSNNILQGADGVSNTFTLDSADAGKIAYSGNELSFTGFIKLIGGDNLNNFVIESVGTTLALDGGTGTSTITGDNNTRTWTVDGAGEGNVSGYAFTNIDNLTGGSVVDTFNISGTIGDITGNAGNDIITVTNVVADSVANIYGGAGDDTVSLVNIANASGIIDGGLHDTQDEFILTGAGENLNFSEITGFELVRGTGGNHTLTKNDGSNNWVVDNVNDGYVTTGGTTISFIDFVNLVGGSAVDTFNVSGTIGNITGNGDDDIITVTNIAADSVGSISGGAGDDTVSLVSIANASGTIDGGLHDTQDEFILTGAGENLNFSEITGFELVRGTGGNHTLTKNDGSNNWVVDNVNDGYVITGGTTISFIDFVNLIGGSADDTFTVSGTIGDVTGNGGADIITVTNVAADSVGSISGGAGDDTVSLVSIASASGTIDGGLHDIQDEFILTGAGENLNFSEITGFELLRGTGGNHTLTKNDGSNNWVVDNVNDGSVTTGGTTISFIDFVNLVGGSAIDTFNVSGTIGNITGNGDDDIITVTNVAADSIGSISGGAGDDTITLDNTDVVTGIIDGGAEDFQDEFILSGSTQILNLTSVTDFELFTNNGIDNTLQGADGVTNTFTLNSPDAGILVSGAETLSFANFIKLLGGDNVNNFIIESTGTSIVTLDGGTGTSTITGDNNSRSWTVDGAGGGNVSGYAFTNVDNLTGGSAVDTFNVSGTIGNITGNAGNDIITVTNASADSIANIYGNAGDDTVSLDNTSVVTGTIDGGLHDTQDEFILTGSGKTLNLTSVTAFELLTNNGTNNILQSADGVSNTFTLDSADAGKIAYNGNELSFTGFIKLIGGDNLNNFVIGSVGTTLALDGGTGTSTITGDNNTRIWTVDGAGEGNVSGYAFTNIDNLTGGSDVDTFNVGIAGIIGNISGNGGNDIITVTNVAADSVGSISGGAGDDTVSLVNIANASGIIDGGLHDTQDEFILTGASAGLNLSEITDFELVRGTGGGHTLSKDDGSNNWLVDNINSGSVTTGGTTISFIDFVNLVGGSAIDTFNVSGTIGNITGNGDDDIITVTNVAADSIGSISGGAGDDTITLDNTAVVTGIVDGGAEDFQDEFILTGAGENLNLSEITGFELVRGTGGNHTLTKNDGSNNWVVDNVNDGSVTTGGITVSFIDFVNLVGGSAVDTFDVSGTIGNITGNGGDDIITVTNVAVDSVASISGGAGDDTITLDNTDVVTGNVDGGAEDFQDEFILSGSTQILNLTSVTDFELFTNNGIDNTLQGADGVTNTFTLNSTDAGELVSGIDTLSFANFTTLLGGDGVNHFIIENTGTDIVTLDGGAGTSSITGRDNWTVWTIDGAGEGNVSGYAFTNVDNLTGGSNVDTFNITDMSHISGLINGAGGNDILNLTADNDTVNLTTDVSSIKTINVTGTGNTLAINSGDNTWTVDSTDSGDINGINFNDFANLVGGSGDDDFILDTRSDITGTIDGGDEATGDSFTVTDANQTVNVSTHFTGIEEVFATSGTNTLVINTGENSWEIDGANSGTVNAIEFTKFADLVGGNGKDTFTVSASGTLNSIMAMEGDDTISLVELDSVDSIDGGDHTNEDTLLLNVTGQTLSLADINVSNIELINGNGNNLQAENGQTNTWQITGSNAGLLNGVSFTNFISLLGGNQQDNFTIATADTGTITLDGGTGTNSLTGGDFNTEWAVTADNEGTVAGFNFTKISQLTGGSADDTFIVSAAIESINAGAGEDKITINAVVADSDIETIILGDDNDQLFIARLDQVQNDIQGNDGTDTLNLTVAGETLDLADISSFEDYVGTGDNTLQATNGVNTWTVTSANAGTVKLGSGTENTFSGFSDLVGGWSKDVFDVSAAIKSIASAAGEDEVTITTVVADSIGTINLGADDDILKIADMVSVTNDIQGGSQDDIIELTGTNKTLKLADIADFETVNTLSNNTNTLQASDSENTWFVNIDNEGTVKQGSDSTINFDGFTDLVGGSEKDIFTVKAAINSISSMAGDDEITIEDVVAGSINNIDTGADNDRIDVHSADSVASLIVGGLGDDVLGITNSNQNLTLAIVDTSIETLDGKDSNNTLVGEGDSVWNITGAKSGDILGVNFINFATLQGGIGTDNFVLKTADVGEMHLDGAGGVNTITGSDNATTWNVFTDNAGNVADFTFESINNLIGGAGVDEIYVLAAIDSITTGAGNDEVTLYNTVADDGVTSVDLGANDDTLTIASLDSVTDIIQGGDDTDTLELTGTGETLNLAGISGFEILETLSAKSNTLQATDSENIWFVNTDNEGTVKLGAATEINFDGFTDLIGGSEKDTFTVSAAINSISSMAGSDVITIESSVVTGSINNIDTGADNDRIDVHSPDSVASLIVGGSGTDTLGITDSFKTLTLDILDSSIETLDGNNLSNILKGESASDNVWTITGSSSGHILGVNFLNFDTLQGGDELDNYVLETIDSGNMLFDGAGGVNTITGFDNATTWNVLTDNAGNVAGFTFDNINNLIGGTSVDKVYVSAAIDSIATGAGNDEVTIDDSVAANAITSVDLGTNDDTLIIADIDSVSGAVEGGDDTDTLELTGTNEALNLTDFSGFEIIKTLNANSLQASDGINIWFVNADNAGTVKLGSADAITFEGFTDLLGGSQKDTFTVSAAINSINAGAGDDEIIIDNTVAANAITDIDLGDDADILRIENINSVTNIIEAGEGTDALYLTGDNQTLTLADINAFEALYGSSNNILQGRNEENTWQVTADNSGSINGIAFTGFNQLVGGSDKDNFTVSAGIDTIDSGAGEDSVTVDSNVAVNAIASINTGDDNDSIILHDMNSISGLVDGGAGDNNTLSFTQAGQVVNLSSDVNHVKTITGITGTNTLIANDEANAWVVDGVDSGHLTNVSYSDGVNFVNFNQLEGGSEIDSFTVDTLANISGYVDGNGNNDTLVLESSDQQVTLGSNVHNIEKITALIAGNNQLTASDTENDWLITDHNQGVITVNNASTVSFSGFENITGGAQRDSFTFSSTDSDIDGVISGGSGTDSLILQVNKDFVIELGSDVSSNLNINEMENISANTSATNTLIADDVDTVWLIDKDRAGNLSYGDSVVSFTNIDNLYGGAQKDTVTLSTGNSANGVSLIDMGDGNDSFIGVSGRVTNLVAGLGDDNVNLTSVNIENLMDGGEGIDSITYNEDVSVTIGDDFVGFESIVAANNTGVINGQSGVDSSWTVTALNTGFVTDSSTQQTALTFTGFSTINGSDGVDSIFIQENGALSGIIYGNDGADTLNVELDEIRNTLDTSVRFDGGDGNDIVSINGVSAQYSESYNPNVEYNSEQFDQLSYNRTDEASVSIYYRDVAVVNDDIATTSLTLNSSIEDTLFIEQGQFSANSASVDVLMDSQNKGDITVQATSDSSVVFTDTLAVDGNLSLSGLTVSQLQGTVLADLLTLNDITLLGTADKALSVDINEVDVNVHSGDIYLDELNDINLGKMNEVTGNITVTSATGSINASDAIISSGNYNLAAAQALNLTDKNEFTGVLSLTAGTDINFVNESDTTLSHVSANTVDIQSSGSVTSTGDFIVENATNDATATIESSLGAINLAGTNSVNNLITIAEGDIELVNLQSESLTATSEQGNIILSQSNQITSAVLQANNDITVADATISSLSATTTEGAITLSGTSTIDNATLVANTAINVENLTAGALILQAGNDIGLSTLTTDSLTATSSNGSILSTEALIVGAGIDGTSLMLTANNGDVSLTSESNDFGQISVIANNAEITDVNSITILGSELAGDLKLTANGDVLVGDIIAGESIYIESKEGAIQSQDSNLTAVEIMLRALSGIGEGTFDQIKEYGDGLNTAITTNTSVISAINNGENGIINITNSEDVSVTDLRNNGDIIFSNAGDINLKVTDVDGATELGAIDAHYNGDTNDLSYAGRISIFNDGDDSIYTDRPFNSSVADITGESLLVSTIIFFGTQNQPIKLRLNNSLNLLNQGGSVAYIYPKPLNITTTGDLSDTSSLAVLTSRNLLSVESLDAIDPAIFSDIRNYNVDSLSILLPRDQLDEEEYFNVNYNVEDAVQKESE